MFSINLHNQKNGCIVNRQEETELF